MGIIRMGVPEDIVLHLKKEHRVKKFIETGTFYGHTANWASYYFDTVDTIEYSESLYKQACQTYGNKENINFHFGDTRIRLRELLIRNAEPNIIWLDAHWCGDLSYGEDDQCPLLTELEIIAENGIGHFILIDDARLFMAPPPKPNRVDHYPDISTVLMKLSTQGFCNYIYEDVIIAVPKLANDSFRRYLQDRTTNDWQTYTSQLVKSKTSKKRNLGIFKLRNIINKVRNFILK